MTAHWRGDPEEQSAMSKFFRSRWEYGSICVLDIDRVICSYDLTRGLLIEEKHASADDKTWRMTKQVAMGRGWWSALFIYETDTGQPGGTVTAIDAEFCSPEGEITSVEPMRFDWFDRWVCTMFGARAKSDAA